MPKTILGKPKDEEKWERAKEKAAEEGHAEEYDYIMAIYKKMAHLNKSQPNVRLTVPTSRDDFEDVRCVNCGSLLFKMKWKEKNHDPSIEIKCRRCGTLNVV